MKLCRFQTAGQPPRLGVTLDDQTLLDLANAGVEDLETVLEKEDPLRFLESLVENTQSARRLTEVQLLAPVARQEVWAAGVTYLRSKSARVAESAFSGTAYDRVYEAESPELFFKALAEKVVGPGEPVGIRTDARWSVPEPELALVFNSQARLVGYTIGNDLSARDLEGENLLYLPQAKIYARSCALGPFLAVGASEAAARAWQVRLAVHRAGQVVFAGETEVGRLRRRFAELGEYLFRSQVFPHGVVLLTGTGIVPPDDFALAGGDLVEIHITGIGRLKNPVVRV